MGAVRIVEMFLSTFWEQANETAHVREEWYDTQTGAAHGVMVPMQKGHCLQG